MAAAALGGTLFIAIGSTPPEYWFGASLLFALAAWVVLRGYHRAVGLRWLGRVPLMVRAAVGGLGVGCVLWLAAPYLRPFVITVPPTPATCAQARALGYGTARIGEPGYFAHLDADGDGFSCEPLSYRRR